MSDIQKSITQLDKALKTGASLTEILLLTKVVIGIYRKRKLKKLVADIWKDLFLKELKTKTLESPKPKPRGSGYELQTKITFDNGRSKRGISLSIVASYFKKKYYLLISLGSKKFFDSNLIKIRKDIQDYVDTELKYSLPQKGERVKIIGNSPYREQIGEVMSSWKPSLQVYVKFDAVEGIPPVYQWFDIKNIKKLEGKENAV